MEIRQLEYFLMVSEVHSFTRAAERLYVSQPAVTNAIKSLEDELGIQLFDRNQKQALLTAEGNVFCLHVKQVMRGISSTIAEINALKNLNSGTLHIGITSLGGTPPFINILKNFHEAYPNIKISFHTGNTTELQKLLIEDQLDMAFMITGRSNSSITYLELPKEELMMCCERRHPMHRRNSVTLNELEEESLILLDSKCLYRSIIIKAFEDANTMPQIAFETNQVQFLISMLAAGTGISILPEFLGDACSDLAMVPINPPIYAEPVIAFKTNRHPSHAAQAFLDIAKKEL